MNSEPQHRHAYLNNAYVTRIFSVRLITASLRSGMLSSALALGLGVILNSEITTHTKKDITAVCRPEKGPLFTVWEQEQEGSVTLFRLSWERGLSVAAPGKATVSTRAWWLPPGELQIHAKEQPNSQTQNRKSWGHTAFLLFSSFWLAFSSTVNSLMTRGK